MLNIPTFQRVALLIDADNAQLSHLEQILKISKYYGKMTICRIYGDWRQPPLSAWKKKIKPASVKIIQVNRIAKQATDKKLMKQAIKILCAGEADIFVIASGDGGFKQLCERIKQKGRKVVGIGNKGQTSTHLKASCHLFYCIEDLEEEILKLEQTRQFKALLYRALDSIPCDKDGWVHFGPLGTKLRELDSDFENRFGSKKLSEWISDLRDDFEIHEQLVRDRETTERIALMRAACIQVQHTDGRAHISQIGQVLRKVDSRFKSLFGKKKLSEWLDAYPHIFKRCENYVSLA